MCQLLGMNANTPTDVMFSFAGLSTPQDRVAIVATEPLTQGEPWQRLGAGELRVFVGGRAVAAGPCAA